MITIKVYNVVHQGRKNQNTTFWFSERNYNLKKEDITEEFLLKNFEIIKPIDVFKQKNTTLKIISLN